MVLWEITLGTAYFLGLKRTYRLGLRLQRKVISLKQPKTRQFVQRQTRAVFDVVLKVHQKVQERDIGMGRNLGKGFILGKDTVNKVKTFDEKHQLSSTASAKVASIDQKMGFSEKISTGATVVSDRVREVDQKFQVSEKTKLAFTAAEQKVSSAGSAIMKNRCVLTGTSWVTGAFNKVAKAAGDLGQKTKEKVEDQRTHAVFDEALKVHQKAQERDIEMGRNIGNYILYWLDQMKPSAEIRSHSLPPGFNSSASMTKQTTSIFNQKPAGYSHMFKRDSDRHLFSASSNILRKPFPSIAMMMRPWKPTGTSIQYRHLSTSAPEVLRSSYRANWSESMIRKDIMQWMLQN